jgi:hypothetical protein
MTEKIESNFSSENEEKITFKTTQDIFRLLNQYRDPTEFDSYLKKNELPESIFLSPVFYKGAVNRYRDELEEVFTKYDGVGWEGFWFRRSWPKGSNLV